MFIEFSGLFAICKVYYEFDLLSAIEYTPVICAIEVGRLLRSSMMGIHVYHIGSFLYTHGTRPPAIPIGYRHIAHIGIRCII